MFVDLLELNKFSLCPSMLTSPGELVAKFVLDIRKNCVFCGFPARYPFASSAVCEVRNCPPARGLYPVLTGPSVKLGVLHCDHTPIGAL